MVGVGDCFGLLLEHDSDISENVSFVGRSQVCGEKIDVGLESRDWIKGEESLM